MAERTINDAFFTYRDADSRLIYAQRGETHDIPTGEDLDRGDKFGAFTAVVGDEPAPPEGVLVDIKVDWKADDFNRFVDAGSSKEILAKLSKVDPANQARIAESLIEAESSKKKRVRSKLVASLNEVANGASLAPEPDDDAIVDDDGAVASSLATFVESSTVDAVILKAGDDPEAAKALRLAEEARLNPRKSLIEALTKIEA